MVPSEQAVESYGGLLEELKRRQLALRGSHARGLFADTVMLQTRLQLNCAQGARFACLALLKGFDGSWRSAFYFAGCAKRAYVAARGAMDAAEHGVWHGYYGNECLVDVAQSVWVMGYLMSFVRNMGGGPLFYQWQRDFIYSKESRKVLTLMNVENHLTDDELFDAICTRWE